MKNNRIIPKILGVCAIGTTLVPIASCSNNNGYFTVSNDKNLEVTFCDAGASIYSIYYKGTCITYQPEDKNYFKHTEKNSGKILGRTCGRIDGGKVKINGKQYQLDRNEHTDQEGGGNTLHGGHNGIGTQNFKHKIKKNKDNKQIIFTYTSPDGEMGYPGTVDFKITYTLFNESDKIRLDMEGTPRTNDPTPICLSGHTYWNLGGNNTEGILDHKLKIPASYIADARQADQVIEGKKSITDAGDAFDFNDYKAIGDDIDDVKTDPVALGYDHGWIFDESESHINEVNLWNPGSKIHLAVDTDINMVFIYANCHAVGCKIKDYGTDLQYGGVSIEPMPYMDNQPDSQGNTYQSIWHTHDNPFKQFIEYNVDIKDSVE